MLFLTECRTTQKKSEKIPQKPTLLPANLIGACDNHTQGQSNSPPEDKYYRNPVVAYSLPDPTVIKADDGYFYLYATEDTRNTPVHQSADLVTWKFLGTAFTDQTRPSFVNKGGIWAPDINYINGLYVLYYSLSVWGGEWSCGIGMGETFFLNFPGIYFVTIIFEQIF